MHVATPTANNVAISRFWLRSFLLFVALLSLPAASYAQGKIARNVTDRSTAAPLPGANVLAQGTPQGTNTDFEGNYSILRSRPGAQTLVCSDVGFSTQLVEDLRESRDHARTIDVAMSEEVSERQARIVQA